MSRTFKDKRKFSQNPNEYVKPKSTKKNKKREIPQEDFKQQYDEDN
jgi:hypothetical protein